MPIKECQVEGKNGYKWGNEGKCYTYEKDSDESQKTARKKAMRQGVVVMQSEGIIKLPEKDND
jgi:hypothetical protein